jgi:hypothetical protein
VTTIGAKGKLEENEMTGWRGFEVMSGKKKVWRSDWGVIASEEAIVADYSFKNHGEEMK